VCVCVCVCVHVCVCVCVYVCVRVSMLIFQCAPTYVGTMCFWVFRVEVRGCSRCECVCVRACVFVHLPGSTSCTTA